VIKDVGPVGAKGDEALGEGIARHNRTAYPILAAGEMLISLCHPERSRGTSNFISVIPSLSRNQFRKVAVDRGTCPPGDGAPFGWPGYDRCACVARVAGGNRKQSACSGGRSLS
jgi:hypothetical protein